MKRSIATSFCLAVAVVLATAGFVEAQTQQKSNFSGLGLKITSLEGKEGSTSPIPGSGWITKFDRVESAEPQDENTRVNAVNFAYKVEGDAVRVEVAVLKTKFLNVSEPVGTFLLSLDETVTINDLIRFGVAPIQISIVKVNTEVAPSQPAVESAPKSLEFIRVEPFDPAIQTYWVSFRNNSNRNLSELGVDTYIGDRKGTISWPRGEQDRPLATAGEVFRIKVRGSAGGKMTDEGFVYNTITRIDVVYALFQDDSYEGDQTKAMSAIAMRSGRRDQLATIVGILRKSLTSPETNPTKAIEALGSQVAALPVEADTAVIRDLDARFSSQFKKSFSSQKTGYSTAMNGIKKNFILDLEKFIEDNGYPNLAGDFHKWLVDAKNRYQQWLDRLQ